MKINLSFLIILFCAILTFVNDIILYCFCLSYPISLAISLVGLFVIVLLLIINKKLIIENYFDKIDLIFLIGFFIFTVIKIVIPNYYYDVLTYHYYNQEYPFIDKLNFDFLVAGGNVNDFVYPLGDRMNYIFRYILGLRLGTILSYYSAVVIYYEIKKLLKFFNPRISKLIPAFAGICVCFIPVIYRFMGSYYIDNYSAVFLLECVYIGISQKEMFKQKSYLYYWFLISGIVVGIKISNLVLLIPIGINVIYNNIKEFKRLKVLDYIISIILFFLPFVIYGINNLIQFGNFFYPFFGRTKYYSNNDWNDPNWGVPNFWYSFIWPFIVSNFPLSGHDEEFIHEWIWAIGYLFIIIDIVRRILKRDIKDNVFRIEIITFIFCILWANFLNGYCRYAIIIPILFIIIMLSDIEFFQKDIKLFLSILKVCAILLVTLIGTRYRGYWCF